MGWRALLGVARGGSLAVSPPSCLLGKVLPKVHPSPGFGTLLARCTRHLPNGSLTCLPLVGQVMWSQPVSENLQTCNNNKDRPVGASGLFVTDKDSLWSPSLNAFWNLSKNCCRRVVIISVNNRKTQQIQLHLTKLLPWFLYNILQIYLKALSE